VRGHLLALPSCLSRAIADVQQSCSPAP
jgi:hypothetical protein